MKAKLGTAFICLLFAVIFGGVGVLASWAIGVTVYDGWRAQEWVRVKALVDGYDAGDIQYRYTVDGREYRGTRLTVEPFKGEDTISEALHARLTEARTARTPVTVFFNPQRPEESMVDREWSWRTIAFLVPFAGGFGGVGLGALWLMAAMLRGKRRRKGSFRAGSRIQGVLVTWVVAFFWNVISFPLALVVAQDAIREGEWIALLVLLFPLIGVLILAGAIMGSIHYLRRGGAKVELKGTPRLGGTIQGHIRFPHGVDAGDDLRVRLECVSPSGGQGSTPHVNWWREEKVQAVGSVSGARMPFRFDVPAKVRVRHEEGEELDSSWRLRVERVGGRHTLPYGFDIDMQPAAGAGLDSDAAPVSNH